MLKIYVSVVGDDVITAQQQLEQMIDGKKVDEIVINNVDANNMYDDQL